MLFKVSKKLSTIIVAALLLVIAASLTVQSDPPEVSFDGLYLEESSKVAVLYLKPDADFKQYKKFIMLDAYVAFRKNWQRDTKVAGRRVSNDQVEKIKTEVSALFFQVFKESLEENDGYPVVSEAGDDVLILGPALIDLDITARDIAVAGRVTNYVASAGAATLYIELYDSVSGEILARIIDRKRMRDYGYMQWSTSVSNRAEARRMLKRWASMLREGLDQVQAEKF